MNRRAIARPTSEDAVRAAASARRRRTHALEMAIETHRGKDKTDDATLELARKIEGYLYDEQPTAITSDGVAFDGP